MYILLDCDTEIMIIIYEKHGAEECDVILEQKQSDNSLRPSPGDMPATVLYFVAVLFLVVPLMFLSICVHCGVILGFHYPAD